MNRVFVLIVVALLTVITQAWGASRQDSLRGGNGSGRNWWNVEHYQLSVTFDTNTTIITGNNLVTFQITSNPSDSLQLDLQYPMIVDSVLWEGKKLRVEQDGDVWWVIHPFHSWSVGTKQTITAYFHGSPRQAKMPPWDGGFIRTSDSLGNSWMSVACQGLGASSWWPCKDHQADEPEYGMDLLFQTNSGVPVISNGRLVGHTQEDSLHRWHWRVQAPINTYNASFYIGDYVHWQDTFLRERGQLDLDFYVLRSDEWKARQHFSIVKPMLRCFEYWMGPYPFYEDGFKLVQAPFAGMEHQSAIAYGNQFKMGYAGNDRSGTGVGMLFDFIIVHESGHEWFGNNITAADVADNWIHEGFTTYAEALFAECISTKDTALMYTRGEWNNIKNDRPVIGLYGINDPGSGDRYDKGAAVVHMIRGLINDDLRFRSLLRSINERFYRRTITSLELEDYISQFSGYNFAPLFEQYLRSDQIPKLEYFVRSNTLFYRFNHAVSGFSLPLELQAGPQRMTVTVTDDWQSMSWKRKLQPSFSGDFLYLQ